MTLPPAPPCGELLAVDVVKDKVFVQLLRVDGLEPPVDITECCFLLPSVGGVPAAHVCVAGSQVVLHISSDEQQFIVLLDLGPTRSVFKLMDMAPSRTFSMGFLPGRLLLNDHEYGLMLYNTEDPRHCLHLPLDDDSTCGSRCSHPLVAIQNQNVFLCLKDCDELWSLNPYTLEWTCRFKESEIRQILPDGSLDLGMQSKMKLFLRHDGSLNWDKLSVSGRLPSTAARVGLTSCGHVVWQDPTSQGNALRWSAGIPFRGGLDKLKFHPDTSRSSMFIPVLQGEKTWMQRDGSSFMPDLAMSLQQKLPSTAAEKPTEASIECILPDGGVIGASLRNVGSPCWIACLSANFKQLIWKQSISRTEGWCCLCYIPPHPATLGSLLSHFTPTSILPPVLLPLILAYAII